MNYWIVFSFAIAFVSGVQTLNFGTVEMPSLIDWANLSSFLRFIAPHYETNQWNDLDREVRQLLSPIHYGLSNNVISPQDAATQFSESIYFLLQNKPEFIQNAENKEGFIKKVPKTLTEAKELKTFYRKKAKSPNATQDDRTMFAQSIRYHNHIKKEQKKRDERNSSKHQEKMYRDNFWEFSKKLCKGELDKKVIKPTFSKETADIFYSKTYSVPVEFNVDGLNWFPYLHTPHSKFQFNNGYVKPKDIKNILRAKKSTSAPGPDGITYGILRKLPSTHHFLATLYSRIIRNSPQTPTLWQLSNVSLIYKRNEPSNPKNFRMIALTSTIGKLFNQIISDRLLEYMIQNSFIDDSIQKAFIKNVNGTIEHNQLLQEVISHARHNKRTCHVTFFDLKDAFGSISHELIDHVLTRYDIPENIKIYINSLYSNISGKVIGNKWSSERFTFNRGVFQGDPLSPTIFICVFNPLLEYLQSEKSNGYYINQNTPIITTPFADDFNVITSNARTHQRILRNIESYAKSMNLILEPTKCKSLTISSGRSKAVKFQLSDYEINSIVDSPEKFLGSRITYSGSQREINSYIFDGIKESLENIDRSKIRDEYKLHVYNNYLLPAIRFKLTVHELTTSNLNKLDNLGDSYVKKWLKMPKSATRCVLHAKEGLNIKPLSHVYREAHAIAHASSRLKADETVNAALESKITREKTWSRKGSTSVYSENQLESAIANPDCSQTNQLDKIKNRIKENINIEFQQRWINQIKALTVQGRFLEILHIEKSNITWRSMCYNLPRGILQFAVNATIDTLATNANLKRWGKRSTANCRCGQRETLHHVLNSCPEMLERYGWRHDSILRAIFLAVSANKRNEIYVDLPTHLVGISTIPTDIMITALRPDLVIVDRPKKNIVLFELSVPFEINIIDTHSRKVERYEKLISDLENCGFKVSYYAFEIGSRGYISKENLTRIKSIIHKFGDKSNFAELKQRIIKTSLVCSFIIYHSKFEVNWVQPALVKL